MRRFRAPAVLAVVGLLLSCASGTSGRVAAHAFYGLDEPHASIASERRLSAELGTRPTVFSVFIRLDTTTTARHMSALQSARLTPFVTLEPWHAAGRSGAADPTDSLRRLIDGEEDHDLRVQAGMLATYRGTLYLRFAQEMNAPWYPWGAGAGANTAADYVRAWRHVHALFSSVRGLHVRWVWSPVVVGNPGALGDLSAFYPGDAFVDDVGLTGYEHSGGSPGATFTATLMRLRAVSRRPVVLSEIGTDSPARTNWLAALGAFIAARRYIAGFVYFDTTPETTGATGRYALSTAAARAAFVHTLNVLKGCRT